MTFDRGYSEDQRIDVLARLEAGESQRDVAAATGIPLATVNRWHVTTVEAAQAVMAQMPDGVIDGVTKTQHASRWSRAQRLAADRIAASLEALPEQLKASEIRDVAIVGGIATDKFLDLTEGRRGEVHYTDARQVHLTVSAEQARALLEAATRQFEPPPNS